MYGKIVNGELKRAPLRLENVPRTFPPAEEGGDPVTMLCTVTNPTAQQYAAAGYLPVYDEMPVAPPDGQHYEQDGWHVVHNDVTGQDEISPIWVLVDDPDPGEQEISAERAVEIIMTGRDSYASDTE